MPFPSREAKFVDRATFNDFHKRWREIDKLWAHFDMENVEVIRSLRENARELLRADVRKAISTGPATCLIAV